MAHVSTHYKIYLVVGHHRQPRNMNAELEPNPSAEVDVLNPGNITPLYIPQIPYTMNGQQGIAELMFWSVTDGVTGKVYPAGPLTQAVAGNPLTITAWYMPISGPGIPNGWVGIVDDAFSAVKGDFIDDTFVTVTSDPSLTSDANVIGIVPTSSAQTLQASASVVSTPEPFLEWKSFGAGTANNAILSVPKKANGIAIAIYQKPDATLVHKHPDAGEAIYGTIIGGVAVDGGGYIIINGKPHPVDPWGPLIVRLIQDAAITVQAKTMERGLAKEVGRLAAKDALGAIKAAIPQIQKSAGH